MQGELVVVMGSRPRQACSVVCRGAFHPAMQIQPSRLGEMIDIQKRHSTSMRKQGVRHKSAVFVRLPHRETVKKHNVKKNNRKHRTPARSRSHGHTQTMQTAHTEQLGPWGYPRIVELNLQFAGVCNRKLDALCRPGPRGVHITCFLSFSAWVRAGYWQEAGETNCLDLVT
ncbi:hypothetical protein BDV19DRAFT_155285 [Aspergillus venezuelensis]